MSVTSSLLSSTKVWLPAGTPTPTPTWPPVAATYKPSASTTGVRPGVGLTPHGSATSRSDITTTTDGQVIQDLDVFGFIYVHHKNVQILNCRVRGSGPLTTDGGLINCMNGNVLNLLVEDCELRCEFPSIWIDGIYGHDYTVRRCNIYWVVDGFGAFNSSDPTQDLNITAEANWVHDVAMLSPDKEHSDIVGGKAVGWTHNDGMQIQGCGSTVGLRQVWSHGNFYDMLQAPVGSVSNFKSPYFPTVTGQCIGITANVSQIHDVVSEDDWLNGGAQEVTMIPGPHGVGSGMQVLRGKYGRDAHFANPIRIDPTINIANMPTKAGVTLDKAISAGGSGNVWEDSGAFVPISRS